MDDRYLPLIEDLTLGNHLAALNEFRRLMEEDPPATYRWLIDVWRDPQRETLHRQLGTLLPRLQL